MNVNQSNRVRPFAHFLFPDEIVIECTKMSKSDCNWHNVPENSFQLTTKNYGWFPTEIVMGVVKGIFTDTNNIGATISGNMGTRSIAVKDINKAIEMLKSAGYKLNN